MRPGGRFSLSTKANASNRGEGFFGLTLLGFTYCQQEDDVFTFFFALYVLDEGGNVWTGGSVCPRRGDLVNRQSCPVPICFCRDCIRHVKDFLTLSPPDEFVIDGLVCYSRDLSCIFFLVIYLSSGLEGTSSSSSEVQSLRGVKPVYLRCSQGSVSWLYPRGALRVVLRYGTAGKEFQVRTCFYTHTQTGLWPNITSGQQSMFFLLLKEKRKRKGREHLFEF